MPVATDCTTLTLVDTVQGEPASLLTENQDSGEEPEAPHEDTCSAPQPEMDKWSDQAIVQRRELRQERDKKLRLASMSGDNPGFEYLKECWDDDPILWIFIKKLLGKFPSWCMTCVDGVLVDCNKE
nr:hypothetical protein [Nostoc sp. FACHB-888]